VVLVRITKLPKLSHRAGNTPKYFQIFLVGEGKLSRCEIITGIHGVQNARDIVALEFPLRLEHLLKEGDGVELFNFLREGLGFSLEKGRFLVGENADGRFRRLIQKERGEQRGMGIRLGSSHQHGGGGENRNDPSKLLEFHELLLDMVVEVLCC